MSCNPYAIFGFGDFSLPPCPSALDDPAVKAASPALFACDDPDPFFCGLSPADFPAAAASLRADLETRARVGMPYSAEYGAYLSRRLARLEGGMSAALGIPTMPQYVGTIDPQTGRDPIAGATPAFRQLLAQQLIATGQLTLSPTDFQSPDAQRALAMALNATATRSPTGGGMSAAPWFGLGGSFTGGTTPIMPFGGFSSAGGFFGGGFSGSTGVPSDAVGGGTLGGFVGQLANTAAGFFAQRELLKQQEDLLKLQLRLNQGGGTPGLGFAAGGRVVIGPDGMLMQAGMGPDLCVPGVDPGCVGPVLPPMLPMGGGGGCCPQRGAVTVSPADAPGLYRQGCNPCSPIQTRSRFFALRSDGTRDLFVKVGKVQSVSQRTLERFARRWAKQARLTTSKRGSFGGRRGRRRPR